MKLKIKEPDWSISINGEKPSIRLSRWFAENVEPINKMLAEGVELYKSDGYKYWGQTKPCDDKVEKALLINIQPIKRETAEDVLREFVRLGSLPSSDSRPWTDALCKLSKRAKAVLGDE